MNTIITLVLIAVATVIVVGIATVISKYSINLDIADIARVAAQVVAYVNQKFVDNKKLNNSDHKLTASDATTAFNMAFSLIKKALNDSQVKYLESKYGDIETALEILIESVVGEQKTSVSGSKSVYIEEIESSATDLK